MLKWIGIALMGLTVLWMVLQRETLGFSPVCAGIALAAALFIIICPTKAIEAAPQAEDLSKKIEETERRAAITIDALKLDMQKVEQKSARTEERCLSYQRLVDVHQNEIEKLRGENQTLAEQLVQKERKIGAMHFSRSEPDLFD